MLDALGHVVTPADSGSAALAFLADGRRVDLVLTDYHMPGMNGMELAREIRRRRPALRIGLVSGTLDVAEDASTVFDFVLAKPVTVGPLRQALGSLPVAPAPP